MNPKRPGRPRLTDAEYEEFAQMVYHSYEFVSERGLKHL